MISLGSNAPRFDLPLAAGGRVSSESLRSGGRPALVVFFKTECPTCKLAFPILERIWRRAREAPQPPGFITIGQNAPGEVAEFFQQYGATFPAACDTAPYDASNAFEITNVPSLFLFDESGVLLKSFAGFDKNAYDTLTEELLSRSGAPRRGSLFSQADAALPALQPG